ncbi:NADPH-dependent FMN reductase [Streptomyces liangshanensis]|uniref:NAD(P)H-dependent oxidoreductase n=1 Tax=Streptomyces liangshanensis TaxID=2717324 RepID=A0A6G9H2P7_9ACTN|nr:NAD(P)H-dependent oxidoreductase [Streptomyces liangshanensis]QIQ04734.1 NAD(P)H-dependent oxidoreductase [Streptomyces liangshanensis]
MLKIAVIIGSTRPNRVGEIVGKWVMEVANKRSDAAFTLIDLAEVGLPLLDEGAPPAVAQYAQQHTKDWAATIAGFDAFVFVTPEYNHSVPAGLKNALDFLYAEWNNKVAGFVSYGAAGGIRAVEHLRLALAELQVATVRAQVALDSYADFENYYVLKPSPRREEALNTVLDQVIAWGGALKPLRTP